MVRKPNQLRLPLTKLLLDLSAQVKNVFRDKDSSASKYFTGDILRQIRISTRHGDTVRRQKWLGRLTSNQKTNVRRLELLPPSFVNSLDALTPFAGQWPFAHISKFRRVSGLHCPEVRDFSCSDE